MRLFLVDVFFAVFLRVVLRLAVFLRVVLRLTVFLRVVLRLAVFLRVVLRLAVFLRVVLRLAVFLRVVLRLAVFLRVVLRFTVFLRVVVRFTALRLTVFLRVVLRLTVFFFAGLFFAAFFRFFTMDAPFLGFDIQHFYTFLPHCYFLILIVHEFNLKNQYLGQKKFISDIKIKKRVFNRYFITKQQIFKSCIRCCISRVFSLSDVFLFIKNQLKIIYDDC